MKKLIAFFKSWRCRKFGHAFSRMEAIIFIIKAKHANENSPTNPLIVCCRCGAAFSLKDFQEDSDFLKKEFPEITF